MSWSEEPTMSVPSVGPPRRPGGPDRRVVAVIAGGLGLVLLTAVIIWLIASGGDDPRVATPPEKRSSTSTSSTTTTTTPSTTTTPVTLPPVTAPPSTVFPSTIPLTAPPGTVIVIPPSTSAPTTAAPTTSPPTTSPSSSTTQPKPPIVVLAEKLEASLTADGQPPPVGSEPRVDVSPPTEANGHRLRVTWSIEPPDDATIPVLQAWQNAAALLKVIQDTDDVSYDRVVLRGMYPLEDTDSDGTPDPERVILLRFSLATLDSIDFDTLDPYALFDLADSRVVDDAFKPPPGSSTTSSTSSTSSTTSTTDPDD